MPKPMILHCQQSHAWTCGLWPHSLYPPLCPRVCCHLASRASLWQTLCSVSPTSSNASAALLAGRACGQQRGLLKGWARHVLLHCLPPDGSSSIQCLRNTQSTLTFPGHVQEKHTPSQITDGRQRLDGKHVRGGQVQGWRRALAGSQLPIPRNHCRGEGLVPLGHASEQKHP